MNEEKEWHDFTPMPNLTVLPWLVWGVIVGLVIAALFYSARLHADPLFSATAEGVTITLTDEPCAVKEIANLPYRATWVEKDKTFQWCWGPYRELSIVLAYFDDRTIAVIPVQAFVKVVGA
jgi:hypothetical protein